ncbi:hypothetical protein HDE68_001784 [Pedobacter cryoconitis]|uniref:Uncharacterized protein n=1 Tax=Pedobacter cryoconitis TaxID=188932 RepID=A0A7W8ZKX7_9SPHI|nr:hypothetical protein [Pedobacter cryoconitis]
MGCGTVIVIMLWYDTGHHYVFLTGYILNNKNHCYIYVISYVNVFI